MTTQNKWDKRTRDKKEQADTDVYDSICVNIKFRWAKFYLDKI